MITTKQTKTFFLIATIVEEMGLYSEIKIYELSNWLHFDIINKVGIDTDMRSI